MKTKISSSIEQSQDTILNELATICNADKSAIIRVILGLYFDKITDESGQIIPSVKSEIETALNGTDTSQEAPIITIMKNRNPVERFQDAIFTPDLPSIDFEKDFKIEKDAKNKAYSFILTNGLFDKFAEFSKLTQGMDHHKSAASLLKAQMHQ